MSTRAIVVGASMAGLLTSRVLSEHFDHVDIFDRDRLPGSAEPRAGVPQARHAHALLGAGKDRLSRWFPGIDRELVAGGAVEVGGQEVWWWEGGAFKVRSDWGTKPVTASRWFLEHTVRQRVATLPGVDIHAESAVDELVIDGDRVIGAVVDGQRHLANLVVDCSGRHTKLLGQLSAASFPAPPVSQVKVNLVYRSRLLRRGPADFDGQSAQVSPLFPEQPRSAVLLPIEGDRWLLTLAGMHDDPPPSDDAGFLAFARSLPTSLIADVIEGAKPLSPIITHRLPSSQRRHFEQLDRWPAGHLALGDAVCSFNPIYGQGMTSSALQAEALGTVLTTEGIDSPRLAAAHYRKVARVLVNPWTLAVAADFEHASTSGPKPTGTDLVNRYMSQVHLATHVSPVVNRQLMLVQNLLAPRATLMRPAMAARVLTAARRSPARRGELGPQPTYRGSSAHDSLGDTTAAQVPPK